MTSHPEVLAYQAPKPVGEWVPRWLRRAVIVAAAFILTMFLIGLPPFAGHNLDHTRNFPLREIIQLGWNKGVQRTLDTPRIVLWAMFAPIAIGGLLAFIFVRGAVMQRVVVGINFFLPVLWLKLAWPIYAAAGPPILFAAVIGQCDGETWCEGIICAAAIASWTTLWLAVTLVLLAVRWHRRRTLSTPSLDVRDGA